MFIRYGRIIDIRINRDRYTGRCKGFAFVAMSREEEVDEVRRLVVLCCRVCGVVLETRSDCRRGA